MNAGVLPGIVAYSSSMNERLREEAAWALANLSAISLNAHAMAEPLVITTLLDLVRTGGAQPRVCMQAVWAVANLAVHDYLKRTLVEHGAVEILMEQIRLHLNEREGHSAGVSEPATDDSIELLNSTLQQSVRAVANLAVEAGNRAHVAAGDGLGIVLRATSLSSFLPLKEVSARCLVHLSFDTHTLQRFIQVRSFALAMHRWGKVLC